MKSLIFLILLCVHLLALANDTAKQPVKFAEGDAAFRLRSEEAQSRKAFEAYRKVYFEDPADPQAAWRFAMASYQVGFKYTPDKEEKKKIFGEARDAGLNGIKHDPRCVPCYFWTAINMALYGQAAGPVKMLFSLGQIKNFIAKAVELDPTYGYGWPLRLAGQIDEALPRILGGSTARAKDHYLAAIQAVPDEPMNYLFLAKLLNDHLGDRAQSIEVIRKGLAVKTPAPDRFESHEALVELRSLLKKLEGDGSAQGG